MSLADTITREVGTPAYVYDLAALRRAHHRLRDALPDGSALYYSLKANPHPHVVAELARLGCRAEVSSPAELAAALAAGVSPAECLYTGPAKGVAELTGAVAAGVSDFSAESAVDLARLGTAAAAGAARPRAMLRVNPTWSGAGAGLAMGGDASQFGVDAEAVIAAPEHFARGPVPISGLHVYLGSNVALELLPELFAIAAGTVAEVARALAIEPAIVDLGGGFPAPYAVECGPADLTALRLPLAALAEEMRARPATAAAELAFESGRYLAGPAGTLLTTVMDVKRSRGTRFVIVDSGIHHLGGMHGLRRLRRLDAAAVAAAAPRGNGVPGPAILAGALCTPLDRWTQGGEVVDAAPGDVLAVPNVGAYGLTASLVAFLGRDAPWEVIVDGERIVEASRLELGRKTHPRRTLRGAA